MKATNQKKQANKNVKRNRTAQINSTSIKKAPIKRTGCGCGCGKGNFKP